MRLLILMVAAVLASCAPTPEEIWVDQQLSRCRAMGSSGVYTQATGVFECWRHAIARNPKRMFVETYRKKG